MPQIHPTAIVEPGVELADDVVVGAYAIIKGKVVIAGGSVIREHSILDGSTRIGHRCTIGPAAYIGLEPQHLRFKNDSENPTYLRIGDDVTIREGAAIHRSATPGLEHATSIGNHCFIMGQTHVAHDCVLANHVIMANGALLGGHCVIGERAFLGGGSALHQFVRVGRLAIVSGNEPVSRDIPPFASDKDGGLKGYNAVGCRRADISRESIAAIKAVYHRLHHYRTMQRALAAIAEEVDDLPEVREIVRFITESKRGIQPSVSRAGAVMEDSES